MVYHDIGQLSRDQDFLLRVAACHAVEQLTRETEVPVNSEIWAGQNAWQMAAQPGFGDAYTYALNSDNESPGKDPSVITDAQILAAVQSILNA